MTSGTQISQPLSASLRHGEMLLNKLERRLLWTGLALRLLLSNALLNMAYPYVAEGGNPLIKLHPGTYILFLAFALMLARLGVIRVLVDQSKRNIWALQFFAVLGAVSMITVWRTGFAGLAYLVDTLIAAAVLAILLNYVKRESLIAASEAVLIFIFVNSLMALAEFAIKMQFMPYDIYRGFIPFRASALLGHPLANALATGSVLLLVFTTNWRTRIQWAFCTIYLAAIMAFGARAAFGISLLALAALQALSISSRLFRGRLAISTASNIPFVLIAILALAYFSLFETNLGARIVELSALSDSSAQARFKIGTIFGFLDSDQLLWGIPQTDRMIIIDKNPYFSIIENFWVGWLLNFGLVLFVPLAASFLYFLYGLARGRGMAVSLAIIAFLLIASSNNSLSAKSPNLLFLVCATAGAGISGHTSRSTRRLHFIFNTYHRNA